MAQGLSKEAFAGEISVTKQTIYTWMEKYPEFLDAIKQGEVKCAIFWEKMGAAGALGKLPGFNAASWIFNMKNRFAWTDRSEQTMKGEPTTRVEVYLPENGREDD